MFFHFCSCSLVSSTTCNALQSQHTLQYGCWKIFPCYFHRVHPGMMGKFGSLELQTAKWDAGCRRTGSLMRIWFHTANGQAGEKIILASSKICEFLFHLFFVLSIPFFPMDIRKVGIPFTLLCLTPGEGGRGSWWRGQSVSPEEDTLPQRPKSSQRSMWHWYYGPEQIRLFSNCL